MNSGMLWIVLSAICLLIFVYPYLIYPLVLRLLAKHSYRPDDGVDASDIRTSLLFCAYNEEAALPEKIVNLRELKRLRPDLDILVYSDCSTDRTNELLRDASDILTPVIGETRTGKVLGMRRLVSMTNADVLVFMDANVILEPASLERLLRYFVNPEIGSVAGTLYYVSDDPNKGTATEQVGGLYWRLEEHIKQLESQTGSMMGADGSIFARRREGYPDLPAHLVDDMAASLSVLYDGLRCVSAPDVRAFERSVGVSAEEFRRKRRIACGSVATYWYMLPQLRKLPWIDRFKFFSHKTLRWWGAVYLLMAAFFAVIGAAQWGFGGMAVALILGGAALLWVLGSRGVPLFSMVLEILLAIVATGVGVLESAIGKTYQTWTPAKSR